MIGLSVEAGKWGRVYAFRDHCAVIASGVLWMKAHNDPRRRHDSQLRKGFGDPPCAPAHRGAERRVVFGQTCQLAVQVMERREFLGLTQTELAEKTGIDQGDISRIERGSIFPNEKTLLRLADALGAEWRMVAKVTA